MSEFAPICISFVISLIVSFLLFFLIMRPVNITLIELESLLVVSINLLFAFYLWCKTGFGEVPAEFKILGGASAIYYLFLAESFDEKFLTLLSFLVNNACIYYLLNQPDLCWFIMVICLIVLVIYLLSLWFGIPFLFGKLFFLGLLSRGFYDPTMALWGFGLVTELLFINLFLINFHNNERTPLRYLIPCSIITFCNLYGDSGVKDICIYIVWVFLAAAGVFFSYFAKDRKELKDTFLVYLFSHLTFGFLLSPDHITFAKIVVSTFLVIALLVSFFYLKALRCERPFEEILLEKSRAGVQILTGINFILVHAFTGIFTPGATSLNWGIGIQILFLGVLIFYFEKKKRYREMP